MTQNLRAGNVEVDPSGLTVVTGTDVQTAIEELDAASGGGGSSLTVQDENSNVSTAVTQIDFQGAGVTATSGSGEVVVTIPGASGAASSHSYAGYNTIGGTWENLSAGFESYNKKITLASAGILLCIEAHLRARSDVVASFGAVLYDDNSNSPGKLIHANASGPLSDVMLLSTTAAGTNMAGRWVGFPMGKYLAAGDYWIALWVRDGDGHDIAVDTTGGTDTRHNTGNAWMADGTRYTQSVTTKRYSIRASVLS